MNKINVFQCREGYLLSGSSHNICRPKCNPACINGACVSPPNVCGTTSQYNYNLLFILLTFIIIYSTVCKKGYSFVPNSKSICHPVCTHQCLNGRCVGPDKCECINDQYEFEDKFRCKPKCSQNCLNGVCVSPNVCKCFPNFDYNRYTGNCMPSRCTRCFGECVAPGLCRCDEKSYFNIFEIVGSTNCEPSCPENCKLSGGYCREVNMCSCPDDFFLGGAVDGWCYPLCKQNCSNGQCIEPNAPDCICPKGLAKDTTGVCRAECVKCGKVKCSPPGICDCNRGTVFDRETKSCRLTCKLCQDDKCSHPPFCCKEELEKYKNGTCVLIPMVVDVQDQRLSF